MKTKSTVLSLGSLLAALAFILLATSPVLALAPFINNQTLTIPENSPNNTFTDPSTIVAQDPEKQPLTYDVLPGGSGNTVFEVNHTTGQYSVSPSELLEIKVRTAALFAGVSGRDLLANAEGRAGIPGASKRGPGGSGHLH